MFLHLLGTLNFHPSVRSSIRERGPLPHLSPSSSLLFRRCRHPQRRRAYIPNHPPNPSNGGPYLPPLQSLSSPLLSLLRCGHLPYPIPNLTDLIAEAQFYGIDPSLLSSSSSTPPPPNLTILTFPPTLTLPITGRYLISAVHVSPSSSIHVGKITSFDFSLSTKSTVLSKIPAIDSLLTLTPNLLSAGAIDCGGGRGDDVGKVPRRWRNVREDGRRRWRNILGKGE